MLSSTTFVIKMGLTNQQSDVALKATDLCNRYSEETRGGKTFVLWFLERASCSRIISVHDLEKKIIVFQNRLSTYKISFVKLRLLRAFL